MFSLEFLQAVSDWQRGGDARQKARRGKRLAELAAVVDGRFRSCELTCLRQVALEKTPLWQLLAERRLPESISSWTVSPAVAKGFKGGVPPEGWQGVIFAHFPKAAEVVLSIYKLYQDAEFAAAMANHASQIDGYADGAGKYGASQHEVVLKIEALDTATVLAMGGYSADRDTLVKMMFQREPTADDIAWFEHYRRKAGIELGAWWLEGEPWERVLARMQPRIEQLRAMKEAQMKADRK